MGSTAGTYHSSLFLFMPDSWKHERTFPVFFLFTVWGGLFFWLVGFVWLGFLLLFFLLFFFTICLLQVWLSLFCFHLKIAIDSVTVWTLMDLVLQHAASCRQTMHSNSIVAHYTYTSILLLLYLPIWQIFLQVFLYGLWMVRAKVNHKNKKCHSLECSCVLGCLGHRNTSECQI